nr:hypothetical protein [Desulfobacula sp.]
MANKTTYSSGDKLNNTAYKIGLLVDLFSATHTKELFFSEAGLAGLVMTLSDIKEEIEAVAEEIRN